MAAANTVVMKGVQPVPARIVRAASATSGNDAYLRAMVLAPDSYRFLLPTVIGESDMTSLRTHFAKPEAVIVVRFAEDATPDATTPEGDSFSVTFTATGDPGELTVFAAIEGSECGDTDHIMVTGTLPNTAMDPEADAGVPIVAGLMLLGGAIALGQRRLRTR